MKYGQETNGAKAAKKMIDSIEQALGETLSQQHGLYKGKFGPTAGRPTVLFSTIHKAKGLGWENVYVDEDVLQCDLDGTNQDEVSSMLFGNGANHGDEMAEEEINVAYVAFTRATRQLMIHEKVVMRCKDVLHCELPPNDFN